MTTAGATPRAAHVDPLTLVAVSMLVYVTATALHEYLGHAAACALLGGTVRELNAFYVDCAYGGMRDLPVRVVAAAGPLVSLVTGLAGFRVLRRMGRASPHAAYAVWLLSTISLMTATGYLMFSGVSGLGDFGTSRDGTLFMLEPAALWRGGITVLGLAGYAGAVLAGLRAMEALLGGEGRARVARAQTLALGSYLSGASMAVLVGLLNPHGMVIVLTSAAASTLGGTSGLAWMMQLLKREPRTDLPLLGVARDWRWIGAALLVVAVYAGVLGPSLRP